MFSIMCGKKSLFIDWGWENRYCNLLCFAVNVHLSCREDLNEFTLLSPVLRSSGFSLLPQEVLQPAKRILLVLAKLEKVLGA